MIIGKLEDSLRIEGLHPAFKRVFDYIKSHDILHTVPGKIDIDGENIWINIAEPEMRNLRDADIEIHKEYIDIQVLLPGKESFGWKATRDLKAEKKAYTRENDIAFYSDKADLIFTLSPGEFVIFFPEDGHAPCIGEGHIKKLVAKIKL